MAINPWNVVKLSPKTALWVIPQSDTYNPQSESKADLAQVEEGTWRNIAAIKTATYNQETEDDPSQFFDAATHVWNDEKNTQIKTRTWELELERYTLFYEALFHGAVDPLSQTTLEALQAGTLNIYESVDPNVPVGVKMELWDGSKHKKLTRYFYAMLKASGDLAQDGTKILRPKVTLEVQPSKYSKLVVESDFDETSSGLGNGCVV